MAIEPRIDGDYVVNANDTSAPTTRRPSAAMLDASAGSAERDPQRRIEIVLTAQEEVRRLQGAPRC